MPSTSSLVFINGSLFPKYLKMSKSEQRQIAPFLKRQFAVEKFIYTKKNVQGQKMLLNPIKQAFYK